jgi:hypothetical protein
MTRRSHIDWLRTGAWEMMPPPWRQNFKEELGLDAVNGLQVRFLKQRTVVAPKRVLLRSQESTTLYTYDNFSCCAPQHDKLSGESRRGFIN